MIKKWKREQLEAIDRGKADAIASTQRAQEALAAAEAQSSRINSLVGFLTATQIKNGFGEDFEITMKRPRERHA